MKGGFTAAAIDSVQAGQVKLGYRVFLRQVFALGGGRYILRRSQDDGAESQKWTAGRPGGSTRRLHLNSLNSRFGET